MTEKRLFNEELDYGLALNKIYDEKGFQGIIRFVKDELEYGKVTEKNGLYCITTGGWSEDEFLVHSLISPVSKFHYHYKGYIVGGAFYFSENKNVDVEMIRVHDYDKARALGLVDDECYY